MATKTKSAPKLEEAAATAEYEPTVTAGDVVTYKDHLGTDRRATVTYVHPPHKALELEADGSRPKKYVPYPESVNLEVLGVPGEGKTRFPAKVIRGEEPGQFRDA